MSKLRLLSQFSLSSLLWLCLLVSILLLWHRDRSSLVRQLEIQNGTQSESWSIDQLLGPPDTTQYGDLPTAWASLSPDIGQEILVVEFPKSVTATAVQIVETYNPGAVLSIYRVSVNGSESLLWEGIDPIGTNTAGGVSVIPFGEPVQTRRLKIVLASAAVPGWNEIDAVGLIDNRGNRQWASAAWASSSYGWNRPIPTWFWP